MGVWGLGWGGGGGVTDCSRRSNNTEAGIDNDNCV